MTDPCLDLEGLYWLDKEDRDRALDYLFEKVDDALWAGDKEKSWPDIEALIELFDLERSSISLQVAVLSITLPIKNRLRGRKEFVEKLRSRLLKTEGERRTKRLLTGLE